MDDLKLLIVKLVREYQGKQQKYLEAQKHTTNMELIRYYQGRVDLCAEAVGDLRRLARRMNIVY